MSSAMPVTYKTAYRVATKIDSKLTAYDFSSYKWVRIKHREGTDLLYRHAFLKKWKEYYLVFTEHHGYHVFHEDDVVCYQYTQNIEKVKE